MSSLEGPSADLGPKATCSDKPSLPLDLFLIEKGVPRVDFGIPRKSEIGPFEIRSALRPWKNRFYLIILLDF